MASSNEAKLSCGDRTDMRLFRPPLSTYLVTACYGVSSILLAHPTSKLAACQVTAVLEPVVDCIPFLAGSRLAFAARFISSIRRWTSVRLRNGFDLFLAPRIVLFGIFFKGPDGLDFVAVRCVLIGQILSGIPPVICVPILVLP